MCMQVVAGLEPEATNAFLQLLGLATSISDGASAVQVCWGGPSAFLRQSGFAWRRHQVYCVGPSGPPACRDGALQPTDSCDLPTHQRQLPAMVPGLSRCILQGLLILTLSALCATLGCSLPL